MTKKQLAIASIAARIIKLERAIVRTKSNVIMKDDNKETIITQYNAELDGIDFTLEFSDLRNDVINLIEQLRKEVQ